MPESTEQKEISFGRCDLCGKLLKQKFICPFCKGTFCAEHRLPEAHGCPEFWHTQSISGGILKKSVKAIINTETIEIPEEAIDAAVSDFTYNVVIEQRGKGRKIGGFLNSEFIQLIFASILVAIVGISLISPDPATALQIFTSTPLLTVGYAFVFMIAYMGHNIATKVTASSFGLKTRFSLTLAGIFLTLFSFVSVIKFIAPGQTMVERSNNIQIDAQVNMAGPMANLFMGFMLVLFGALSGPFPDLLLLCKVGAVLNGYIAIFSMIPIPTFNGAPIFVWNKTNWFMITIMIVLLIITGYSL